MSNRVYYDVCNDYSIIKRDKPGDLWKYTEKHRKLFGFDVILYTHKFNKELHYMSCDVIVNFTHIYR